MTFKTNLYHQVHPEGTPVPETTPAAPAKPTRPWLPELLANRAMGDPVERTGRMNALIAGRQLKTPDNWMGMSMESKAEYLDKNYPLEVE